ncbi:hypothetical protein EBZ80_06235 [bacterium]|nr:hypothetical protein [bacterium]
MFSAITETWPPAPGPEQPTTGERHAAGILDGSTSESLAELHDGGWWIGSQLSVPADCVVTTFRVRLQSTDGEVVLGEWQQAAGATLRFPWPIPAAMATNLGLILKIRSVPPEDAENAPPVDVSRRIFWKELPDIAQTDRFVFLNHGDHHPRMYWNGAQEQWGEQGSEQPPSWGLEHIVVPPLAEILAGEVLYPERWTLMAWTNDISLDPDSGDD